MTVVVVLSKTALADGDSSTGGERLASAAATCRGDGDDTGGSNTVDRPSHGTNACGKDPSCDGAGTRSGENDAIAGTDRNGGWVTDGDRNGEVDVAAWFNVKVMFAELLTRIVVADGLTDEMRQPSTGGGGEAEAVSSAAAAGRRRRRRRNQCAHTPGALILLLCRMPEHDRRRSAIAAFDRSSWPDDTVPIVDQLVLLHDGARRSTR